MHFFEFIGQIINMLPDIIERCRHKPLKSIIREQSFPLHALLIYVSKQLIRVLILSEAFADQNISCNKHPLPHDCMIKIAVFIDLIDLKYIDIFF